MVNSYTDIALMQRYNMLCLLIVCDLILSCLVKEASYNLHVYLLEEICYPLKWRNLKHLNIYIM